jgi:hypothetical protein
VGGNFGHAPWPRWGLGVQAFIVVHINTWTKEASRYPPSSRIRCDKSARQVGDADFYSTQPWVETHGNRVVGVPPKHPKRSVGFLGGFHTATT